MVRNVFDMAYSFGSLPARDGQYLCGAQRWVHANGMILAFARQYLAQALLIRYEDLARGPDQAMARVLAHLDLPTFPATAQEARRIVADPHLGNVLGAVSGDFIGKGRVCRRARPRQG